MCSRAQLRLQGINYRYLPEHVCLLRINYETSFYHLPNASLTNMLLTVAGFYAQDKYRNLRNCESKSVDIRGDFNGLLLLTAQNPMRSQWLGEPKQSFY